MRIFSKMPAWAIMLMLVVVSNISKADEVVAMNVPSSIEEEINAREIIDETVISNVIGEILSGDAVAGKIIPPVSEAEIDCMAKNIYFEAGAESYQGQLAVAQVTINRVESDRFPDTVCGVVHQRTTAKTTRKTICQFSWVCEAKRQVKYNSKRWLSSLDVARKVLVEGVRHSGVTEALFYHNTHVNPQWGLKRIVKIGGHIFFSPEPARRFASNS